ncbi:MAG: ribose 5-phosphate isomerase A [Anaerolineae bacterium]
MDLKELAAREAQGHVRDGMVLGLGSGTTMRHFLALLGQRLQAGELRDVVGVATSAAVEALARRAGIPLTTLEAHPRLDLAVDGADEVGPRLDLIKGLGRALLREKIVAAQADRFLIIVDESKLVERLGAGPLPVEILPFGAAVQVRWLQGLSSRAELWREDDGRPIVTDNGNHLARCWFEGGIPDPQALARALADRAGIVEHGLFLGMADAVIVAGPQGARTLAAPDS